MSPRAVSARTPHPRQTAPSSPPYSASHATTQSATSAAPASAPHSHSPPPSTNSARETCRTVQPSSFAYAKSTAEIVAIVCAGTCSGSISACKRQPRQHTQLRPRIEPIHIGRRIDLRIPLALRRRQNLSVPGSRLHSTQDEVARPIQDPADARNHIPAQPLQPSPESPAPHRPQPHHTAAAPPCSQPAQTTQRPCTQSTACSPSPHACPRPAQSATNPPPDRAHPSAQSPHPHPPPSSTSSTRSVHTASAGTNFARSCAFFRSTPRLNTCVIRTSPHRHAPPAPRQTSSPPSQTPATQSANQTSVLHLLRALNPRRKRRPCLFRAKPFNRNLSLRERLSSSPHTETHRRTQPSPHPPPVHP